MANWVLYVNSSEVFNLEVTYYRLESRLWFYNTILTPNYGFINCTYCQTCIYGQQLARVSY